MNLDWLLNLTDWKIVLSLFLSFFAGAVIGMIQCHTSSELTKIQYVTTKNSSKIIRLN